MKRKKLVIYFLFLFIFQLSFAFEEKFNVKVYSEKMSETIYNIVADNEAPFPQQMEVNFKKIENMEPSAELPFYCEIGSSEKKKFLFKMNVKKKARFGYQLSYKYFIGGVKESIPQNNIKYMFPFESGKKYMLSQGNNGKLTHNGSSKYAFDFNMEEGTKICAARDGIIAEIRDGGTESGEDKSLIKEGNHIVIYHKDGSLAMYSHLQNKGVKVKLGDYVEAGEVIGLSGNTGYSTGPHLHFVVLKPVKLGYESIEIEFIDKNRKKFKLHEGEYYGNN